MSRTVLAPLIGNASVVTFIGLCKNAGKTTALCRLFEELPEETLALTSVGRDGEHTDLVTGTQKPRIWVKKNTLFATARGMLPLCDTTTQVLHVTDVFTPLGQVAVLRAQSDGYIQIAGPSSVAQLTELEQIFRQFGADRVLIDGAAGRRSLASTSTTGTAILCVGASMEGGIAEIVAETSHICTLFQTQSPSSFQLQSILEKTVDPFALFTPTGEVLSMPLEHGAPKWGSLPKENCILWVSGAVTDFMLRTLAQRGIPVTVAVPDVTHILANRKITHQFLRQGCNFLVRHPLTLAAVCANPWSARGHHLEREALLTELRQAVSLPVIDVKEELP